MILAETMIPGEWMTSLIVAVISSVGAAIVAYKKGAAAAQDVSLKSPVPEVPTRKVFTPPSWDAHKALMDRVTCLERVTQELARDMSSQYRELMKAGSAREQNLSDKLDGIARGIHARIDEYLNPHH